MILDHRGLVVGWHGPLGPAVACFDAWTRESPLFVRHLGTPGVDLEGAPQLWRVGEGVVAFWCEEEGAIARPLAKDGSAGERVCVAEGARTLALATGQRRATLFSADERGLSRVDVDREGRPQHAAVRCVAERRAGAMLAATRMRDEALLAFTHRGASSFGTVLTRGRDHLVIRHPSAHRFESLHLGAAGTRAALVLEGPDETLELALVGMNGKMIERPHPVPERHRGALSAPRVLFAEDDFAILARDPESGQIVVSWHGRTFALPRCEGPFAATHRAGHFYALEVESDAEGAELRLWRCTNEGDGQQQRVVRVVAADARARTTRLGARRVLTALGERLARAEGYRDRGARPTLARDGSTLRFADDAGRLSLALTPSEAEVRLRVVSTLGDDDPGLVEPPSSLVRLARWVKDRLSPAARELAKRERAWADELAARLEGRVARIDRAGRTLILELLLDALPALALLETWLRELRREQREQLEVAP